MAGKYLNGTYASGYTLSGVYTEVTLGDAGSIGGTGLVGGTNASYAIAAELDAARRHSEQTGKTARRFRDFSTLDSWSQPRRVIGKAEWTDSLRLRAHRPTLAACTTGTAASYQRPV